MPLPIGISDFRELVEYRDPNDNEYIFVDKTEFIKEVAFDGSKVIVITRPRRFGKTVNLSMLRYFFADEVRGKITEHLFDGLAVTKDKKCMAEQGKYPVIFITFKDIKQQSYNEAINKITLMISRLYEEHNYLLLSDHLSKNEKNIIKSFVNRDVNMSLLQESLSYLSQFLYQHFGLNPILLIDEYDTPIIESYLQNYYDDFMSFMRGLFGAGLKDNLNLHKAVITGITRVAKEGLFSGVNNLEIYTFMQSKYSDCFGFTEPEVTELFNKAKVTYNADIVKKWYNGYKCDDTTLYNPWSILKCIKENGKPGPYWINTSSNELIKKLVLRSTFGIRDKLKQLLQNEEIEELIDEHIGFVNLFTSSSAIWSMLLMAGYLKVISSKEGVFGGRKCVLKVPNMEILGMFKGMIAEWLASTRGIAWYESFLQDLLSGNIYEFTEKLRLLLEQSASYHDVSIKTQESFYHGVLLGLIVGLGDQYVIKSNRESGKGRYDLMIAPKKDTIDRVGIVMELKVAAEGDEIAVISEQALQQIDTLKYITDLQDFAVDRTIKIGIAFFGTELECSYNIS